MVKNRRLEILLYLLEVKKTTYKTLVERFEVSKQTAIRDIDALSSMGIPICTQSGRNGGIYIPETYKLDRTFFTQKELESLVFALHLSSAIHVEQQENSILHKLELLIPDLVFARENRYRQRVKVDLIAKPISTNSDILRVIDQSLDEEKDLQVDIGGVSLLVRPLNYLIRSDGLFLECIHQQNECRLPVAEMTACTLLTPDAMEF